MKSHCLKQLEALFVMKCGLWVSISAAATLNERAEWCSYPTCLLPYLALKPVPSGLFLRYGSF